MEPSYSTVHLDPDAHLVQGMSYVGCATRDMADRSSYHLPSSEYEGSNYTWWLTMSCIKDMGLSPVVRIAHAIRTWEPEQLPISEVLVTVLAHSMVEDCGFNVWPPGRTIDEMSNVSHNWDSDIYDVMYHRTYLPDQLQESSERMEEFADKLTTLEKEWNRVQDSWLDLTSKVMEPEEKIPDRSELEELREGVLQRHKIVDAIGVADADLQTCVEYFSRLLGND